MWQCVLTEIHASGGRTHKQMHKCINTLSTASPRLVRLLYHSATMTPIGSLAAIVAETRAAIKADNSAACCNANGSFGVPALWKHQTTPRCAVTLSRLSKDRDA